MDFDGSYVFSTVLAEKLPIVEQNIHIYPNPARSIVTVDCSNLEAHIVELELINDLGQVIYQRNGTINSKQYGMDTTNWETGVYQLLVKTSKGMVYNRKIVLIE